MGKGQKDVPIQTLADGHTFVLPILRKIGMLFSSESHSSTDKNPRVLREPWDLQALS